MFGVINLWTYVIGVIFIVLLPGPNSLYVLSVAAQRGVRAGYRGAFGVFLGDTVLMVLAAAGAASLLETNLTLYHLVQAAGALYLGWLGVQMLRAAWKRWHTRDTGLHAHGPVAHAAAAQHTKRLDNPFRKALFISLLNPKAILFFVSFFIQFVDPHYPHPALSFLLLGIIVQFFSALYLSVLIFGGSRVADAFRRRRRLSALTMGLTGTGFFGFGVKLALAATARTH
ncbi:leucine efflux protein LeuE [Thiomonas sp.]|jgi:leucine efflux protein|uniref:leucine efflux protein LeuE n=1 Tax=Thiomonas sp. TaxID=2047785 RepID=UPI00261D51B4|nr:leucine efflux protein LeuE [Thiomonas sp.]